MDMSKISAGKDLPHDFNVVIEIPAQSDPVKYDCLLYTLTLPTTSRV